MKNPFKQFEGQSISKDIRPTLRLTLKRSVPINSKVLEDGTVNPAHMNPNQMGIKNALNKAKLS